MEETLLQRHCCSQSGELIASAPAWQAVPAHLSFFDEIENSFATEFDYRREAEAHRDTA